MMNKTNRMVSLLLLLALLLGLLAGCQSQDVMPTITVPSQSATTSEAATTPTEASKPADGSQPPVVSADEPLTEKMVEDYFNYLTRTYSHDFLTMSPEGFEQRSFLLRYETVRKKKVIVPFKDVGDYISAPEKTQLQTLIENIDDDYYMEEQEKDPDKTIFKYQNMADMQRDLDEMWGPGRIAVEELVKEWEKDAWTYYTSSGSLLCRYSPESEGYQGVSYMDIYDIYINENRATFRAHAISVSPESYFSEYGYIIDQLDSRIIGKTPETRWADTKGEKSLEEVVQELGIDAANLGSYMFTMVKTADGLHLELIMEDPFRAFGNEALTPDTVLTYATHCEINAEVGLNLRAGPGTQYDVLTILPHQLRVSELGYQKDVNWEDAWLFVAATVEGKEYFGWVTREYLRFYDGMAKPVIYLYPEKEQEVDVKVTFTGGGGFTCTYPDYGTGWQVTAQPDGTLTNKADSREYSYLYWEGAGHVDYDMSRGFVVAGKDTAAFFQEKLAYLGLTPREYNEFIVYWLPLMHNNPYNLITFQTTAYTNAVDLQVTPAPDSMLRVYMVYQPLTAYKTIQPQELEPFEREGFAVIEWGGTEYGK